MASKSFKEWWNATSDSTIKLDKDSAEQVWQAAQQQYLHRLAAVREVAQSGDAAVEVFLKGRRETLTDNYRIP